jgi:hypothetical protein
MPLPCIANPPHAGHPTADGLISNVRVLCHVPGVLMAFVETSRKTLERKEFGTEHVSLG